MASLSSSSLQLQKGPRLTNASVSPTHIPLMAIETVGRGLTASIFLVFSWTLLYHSVPFSFLSTVYSLPSPSVLVSGMSAYFL